MGDRCYLEMTMRKADLQRFAPFVDAKPGEEWFDFCDETDTPGVVNVGIYEANYGWYDERQAAAKAGLAFYGTHSEGGEYGSYAFAALNGEQCEVPVSHDGHMFIAIDDDLKPIDDIEVLRAYVAKRRTVEELFNKEGNRDGRDPDAEVLRADQPQGHQDVSAGIRAA